MEKDKPEVTRKKGNYRLSLAAWMVAWDRCTCICSVAYASASGCAWQVRSGGGWLGANVIL